MKNIQCCQPADDCRHNGGEKKREWGHVALIKKSQNHIHDEDRRKQQQRQGSKQLSEHECLTLEGSLHSWVMRLDLSYRILDVLRSIADRGIGQQIEIKSDTGELVEMIHRLRSDDFLG